MDSLVDRCRDISCCMLLFAVCHVSSLITTVLFGFEKLTIGSSMYFHKSTELSSITAAWLLPVVAPIVAAASGGIVAAILPNPQHALLTVIVSYVLWGTGVPLAMVVLVIYFQRLTVFKLPPAEVIVSVFLPLGPLGQGGFAIMQLGKVAMTVFPKTNTLGEPLINSGYILYVNGWMTAIVMWGFGLVWLFFALASISRSKFPFNMGWWGFTFPLGVFTVSTVQIGKELPSKFFSVLGTVCCVEIFF
jgi:tellurite resistance protein TehA-like permease